jgi:hypothetical protein
LNVQNLLIDIMIGILANLATDLVKSLFKKRKGLAPEHEERPLWKGRFEVMAWSFWPIFYTVAALALIQSRWPLNWPGKIILLAGGFLIATGMATIIKYFSARWSPNQTLSALVVTGFGVAIFLFIILDWILPHFIALDTPDAVSTRERLRGRVIDSDWRAYVLVWPHGGGGPWVFPGLPPSEDGTWYVSCSFSGGDGDLFDVAAYAVPPDLSRPLNSPSPEADWVLKNALHKTTMRQVRIQELKRQ